MSYARSVYHFAPQVAAPIPPIASHTDWIQPPLRPYHPSASPLGPARAPPGRQWYDEPKGSDYSFCAILEI